MGRRCLAQRRCRKFSVATVGGGLADYYRDNVVGGPGAFVLEAKDFNSFGQAIVKKLIAEIADAAPPQ
ncbi:MAG: DUF1194 domain-containing protein [Pseudolabrys sp.]